LFHKIEADESKLNEQLAQVREKLAASKNA